jgi:FKBP-type peptidyl-prolyl cis-trans isomerase
VLIAVIAVVGIGYLIFNRSRLSGATGTEITTASGLRYIDRKVGDGPSPQAGQTVTVHYVGTLERDGSQFDSSRDRGVPADFRLTPNGLIKGFYEGLLTMKVGGSRRLIIPPALGYGPTGNGPKVPPNSTLVFEVELLGIK